MLVQKLIIKFSTQPEYTHTIFNIVDKLLDLVALDEKKRHEFTIALGEALDNAIVHGNKLDKNKSIETECIITEDQITCDVKDSGHGFDYKSILDQPIEQFNPKSLMKRAHQGQLGGLGIALIRKCVDKVSFNKKGNKISFTKGLTSSSKKELVSVS